MANKQNNNKVKQEAYDVLIKEARSSAEKKVNTIWVICILSFLVALLIVWCISQYVQNGDNLIHGIENFATIISILLSITSILYAHYTSETTSRQNSDIASAVTEIKTFSQFMSTNNQMVLSQIRDITKDVAVIRAKQNEPAENNKSEKKSVPEGVEIPANNKGN